MCRFASWKCNPPCFAWACHSLFLLCFRLQTARSGGNWKVRFSLVWLTQTVRRTQVVSTESLFLFFFIDVCVFFCGNVFLLKRLKKNSILSSAAKHVNAKVSVSTDGDGVSAHCVLLLMSWKLRWMGSGGCKEVCVTYLASIVTI